MKLNINGELIDVDVDVSTPLLWALREQLGLTGAKYSCGIGLCGTCTVLVDDRPVRACITPVSAFTDANEITTIEGLSVDNSHPVQRAWQELDVPQCGYCQPGMILQAADLLTRDPNASEEEMAEAMDDVICRCGTHPRVMKAMKRAANQMNAKGGAQ